MKQHAAIAIAALMIASMAFVVSTSSVSAAHEQTPTIDETTVKGSTSMILTITINNAGPAAIDNVRITVPVSFADFAPVLKIPKDNEVTLEDNWVTLKAGTIVELGGGDLRAVENTPIIIPSGAKIRWKPVGDNVDGILNENLSAKLVDNFDITVIADEENAELTVDVLAQLADLYGTARLLADTLVVRGTDNKVRLPESTLVELVSATTIILRTDNEVKLVKEKPVILDVDNLIYPPDENTGQTFVATSTAGTNTLYNVVADDNVLIWALAHPIDPSTENIVFPAGTVLEILGTNTVDVFENTEVIREEDENVKMTSDTATAAENQPKDWTQTWTEGGVQADWAGIEENQIASGANLEFPFAVTTPSTSGDYTILVRTTDTAGKVIIKEVTVTVDADGPTVELAVSPEWAKASTGVTITVTADEPLAKLDNVMVAENENTENVQVTMTPNADKTVWTGTYTTTDNENRDGLAKVWVIGTQLEDLLGNEGEGIENATFCVDKLKPSTPSVMGSIYGWDNVDKKYTNDGEWLIEGYAEDNYLGSPDYPEGMTVKIRVGTTTHDVTSGADGYFYKSITLTEGVQEVGIQYVDLAGNAGDENVENITYDATKPSISITSPADGAIINDSTPTIKLTISDVVMGIENAPFDNDENRGYGVWLCWDNDDPIEGLDPKTDPAEDPIKSFAFENDYPDELADGWYKINVAAGDNLQQENVYFRFEVDVTAPIMPLPLTVANNPVLYGTSAAEPKVQKTTTLVFYGSGLDPPCTAKIYLIDQATGSVISTETTEASAAGDFSKSLTLAEGKVIRIEVETVDVAGNVSSMVAYGYVMVDATAPAVALTALPETTDRSSVIISGTVTKDSWEGWPEITLTVQLGTGRVAVPITPVSGNEGSYSYSLALAEGSNTIVVQAIDDAGNASTVAYATVERTVTPWAVYAIILVIVALVLAAIAIFGGPRLWKR